MDSPEKTENRSLFLLLFEILLVLLIVVGVFYRFNWNDWHEGADLHPDEYGLTGSLSALQLPQSWDEYFNTRLSPISPYQKYDIDGNPTMPGPDNRMRWGQWPIILLRAAAELTDNTGYDDLRRMGRSISALFDALTILTLIVIGARLYGRRAGLLAAALYALAVMPIQQAHFMTSDHFSVFFTAVAMYAAVEVYRSYHPQEEERAYLVATQPAWRRFLAALPWYVLFGVALGMAVASRINLAVLAGVIVVAALLTIPRQGWQSRRDVLAWAAPAALGLALAAVFSLVTFRVTQPMSFRAPKGDTGLLTVIPNPDWVDSMEVAQNESRGVNAGPPGEQWTNRIPIVFPFVNMVVWGMGIFLGLAAWAGLGWAVWQILQARPGWRDHVLPLVWAGGFFLFMGTRHVMSIRYFLPVYPFFCLFAAWALVAYWDRKTLAAPRRFPVLPAVLAGVVVLGTFAWATSFVQSIYVQGNTRIRASRWMFENIPAPFTLHISPASGPEAIPVAAPDGLQIAAGMPYMVPFVAPSDCVLNSVSVPHLLTLPPGDEPVLKIVVATNPDGSGALTEASVRPAAGEADGASTGRGPSASADFTPVLLEKGREYYLMASIETGAPVLITRTVIANENWDESLPVRADGYDPFGMFYSGLTMEVRWPDDENKRNMYLQNLQQVEYIILPSQRGLWSVPRLPEQYPLTMEYYRALFDGRLGFELVAQFQNPLRFGPLRISDVGGTAAWGQDPPLPLFNNNLLAAEEAFSVYDHAPVWIFKKTKEFSIDRVVEILYGVELP